MSRIEEQLSDQFHQWELRGRGWQVFAGPVTPEPPFRSFLGHFLPETFPVDDGHRPTTLSSFIQKLSRNLSTKPEEPPLIGETEEEPEPEALERCSLVELQMFLPANLNARREEFEQFLFGLSLCREPVTFELLGTFPHIIAQFAVHPSDESLIREQLHAFFPDAVFLQRTGTLEEAWSNTPDAEVAIVEFGLAREFMFSLNSARLDPFVGITGALAAVRPEELGLFQVIFQPVRHDWAQSILRSVTDSEEKPFFVNVPELVKEARNKISKPLYAAVIRIATKSPDYDRAWEIARNMASSLSLFARPDGNELIPLKNNEYHFEMHQEDVLRRQSRRSGMLLNSEELIGFVHLPSIEVRSPKLARQTLRSKLAPEIVRNPHGLVLGDNVHRGVHTQVALSPEQRVRHVHIIGGSGTGKSTLLFNLIRQDIDIGAGVAVLDPHGDLVDRILGIIPREHISDVVLLDPSDEEYSVGFNILSAHSDLEKNLLASDLVSVFQRLSTSWGDQMGSVLNNAILAFLESSQGGTLADLRRFLIEREFREKFLNTVGDPDIVYYWKKGFAQLTGNKSIGPVLTRLETFLSPKPIRYMVSQATNRLDFGSIMDRGKIFLAKLSQGLLGKENSFLLGTLLVSKFQQLAMARQRQAEAARKNFTVFIDEFHNFITPSMAEILSGARKYRIGLVLAHQELRQLQRDSDVASAVLSNPGTRICFRVGDDDARKLADGFSFFEAKDLQNLSIGEAICRVERSDFDFNLTVPLSQEPSETEATERRQEVITASRRKYATLRTEVEAVLYKSTQTEEPRSAVIKTEQSTEPPRIEKSALTQPQPMAPVERIVGGPVSPADMGRGGAQHQAIQRRIKEAAEALGFRSVIEHQISGGSVDLLLERRDQTIACEISITTTIDHEVGNVGKCLRSDFSVVAVICLDEDRLQKIAVAVAGSFGAEMARRVKYMQPDQFIAQLEPLHHLPSTAEKPQTKRRGYIIKRSMSALTPDEQKRREEAGIRSVAEAMRRKGR